MTYRTKTYIAGDWTGDKDAIEQLQKWNSSNYWGLSFNDAHDITQARDNSLSCSIKRSLAARMNLSKTFVLVVGKDTLTRRSGECNYCPHLTRDWYNNLACRNGGSVSNKSYLEYEIDKAIRDGLNIVALYNYSFINKDKCPEALKSHGKHARMYYISEGKSYWDYQSVKDALNL